MEISVTLRVRSDGSWSSIADKTASLDMPVSEDDADWKETIKDKLQFFMQEAAEMLIPAVKKSVDSYCSAPSLIPMCTNNTEENKQVEADNAPGNIANPFTE